MFYYITIKIIIGTFYFNVIYKNGKPVYFVINKYIIKKMINNKVCKKYDRYL